MEWMITFILQMMINLIFSKDTYYLLSTFGRKRKNIVKNGFTLDLTFSENLAKTCRNLQIKLSKSQAKAARLRLANFISSKFTH